MMNCPRGLKSGPTSSRQLQKLGAGWTTSTLSGWSVPRRSVGQQSRLGLEVLNRPGGLLQFTRKGPYTDALWSEYSVCSWEVRGKMQKLASEHPA